MLSTGTRDRQIRCVVSSPRISYKQADFSSSSLPLAFPHRLPSLVSPLPLRPLRFLQNMIILNDYNWDGLPEALDALLADQKRAESIAENAVRTLRGR